MNNFFYWLFSKNHMSGLNRSLFLSMPILAVILVAVMPENKLIDNSRAATLEILMPIVLVMSLGMTLPAFLARKYLQKNTEQAKRLIKRLRTKDAVSYPNDEMALDALEIYIGLLVFMSLIFIWFMYKSLTR